MVAPLTSVPSHKKDLAEGDDTHGQAQAKLKRRLVRTQVAAALELHEIDVPYVIRLLALDLQTALDALGPADAAKIGQVHQATIDLLKQRMQLSGDGEEEDGWDLDPEDTPEVPEPTKVAKVDMTGRIPGTYSLSNEKVLQIIDLVTSGVIYPTVAVTVGCHQRTVQRVVNKYIRDKHPLPKAK